MPHEYDFRLVHLAEEIATKAHAGQMDKQGRPYIEHPRRVAARMDTFDERIVAWLHDVIEDTPYTADDLVEFGIPPFLVSDVVILSRTPEVPDDLYYEIIRQHPRPLKVKVYGDIADHIDPRRLLPLPEPTRDRLMRKYAHALDVLVGPL